MLWRAAGATRNTDAIDRCSPATRWRSPAVLSCHKAKKRPCVTCVSDLAHRAQGAPALNRGNPQAEPSLRPLVPRYSHGLAAGRKDGHALMFPQFATGASFTR